MYFNCCEFYITTKWRVWTFFRYNLVHVSNYTFIAFMLVETTLFVVFYFAPVAKWVKFNRKRKLDFMIQTITPHDLKGSKRCIHIKMLTQDQDHSCIRCAWTEFLLIVFIVVSRYSIMNLGFRFKKEHKLHLRTPRK